MKRKRLQRDTTGRLVEVYVDCGPSRAIVGHGRPMRISAVALGGGTAQQRLGGRELRRSIS